MFVKLIKVRRDGQARITTINVSEIKGYEEASVTFKGVTKEGTKVYANGGNFRVPAPVLALEAAIQNAIASGTVQELPGTDVTALLSNQKKIGKPKVKYLSKGYN